jgi:NtrC-family two-component system response regulator AlgB
VASSRNLEDAARTLGIDPATLYRKRVKLGLQ